MIYFSKLIQHVGLRVKPWSKNDIVIVIIIIIMAACFVFLPFTNKCV